jgi:hypothetical protein
MIVRDQNGHVLTAGVSYDEVLERYPDLTHLSGYVYDDETQEVVSAGTEDSVVLHWDQNDVVSRALFLLAETDWVVTRATERAQAVSAPWQSYRDSLRALVDWEDGDELSWPEKPET